MRNSLKGTILDKITVDEFTPKSGISEEIAVVAFYAIDEEPAQDLNTFIQRGYIEVVDAEVSPNPDEDGNYLIFVEIARDQNFLDVFLRLIKDIENLTGSQDWNVKPYSAECAYNIDDPELVRFLTFGNVQESIKSFLLGSNLSEVFLEDNNISFGNTEARLKEFGSVNHVMKKYALSESAIDLDSPESQALESALGNRYQVSKYGSNVFIASVGSNNAIVLENLIFK